MAENFKSPVSTIPPRGQAIGEPQFSGAETGRILRSGRHQQTQSVGTVTQLPAQTVLPMLQSIRSPKFEQAFWSRVKVGQGCWEWSSSLDGYGYGIIRPPGVRAHYRAHRISYFLSSGEDPGQMQVCHHCDNPACVKPAHLFLGTAKDNSDDKIAKGRDRVGDQAGEKNPNAKIGEAQVREVVRLIGEGLKNTEIAKRAGVCHSQVSNIRNGKSWRPLLASMGYEPRPSKLAPKSGRTAAKHWRT